MPEAFKKVRKCADLIASRSKGGWTFAFSFRCLYIKSVHESSSTEEFSNMKLALNLKVTSNLLIFTFG